MHGKASRMDSGTQRERLQLQTQSDHWVDAPGDASADAIDLLDISEAAQFLNVSETSLRRWTNDGLLACLRIGRRRERRFRRTDLLAFLEQPTAAPSAGNGEGGSMKTQKAEDESFAAFVRDGIFNRGLLRLLG